MSGLTPEQRLDKSWPSSGPGGSVKDGDAEGGKRERGRQGSRLNECMCVRVCVFICQSVSLW